MSDNRIVSSSVVANDYTAKISGKANKLQSSSTTTPGAGTVLTVNSNCIACENKKSSLLKTYGDIAGKDAEKIQKVAQSFADLDQEIAVKTSAVMGLGK